MTIALAVITAFFIAVAVFSTPQEIKATALTKSKPIATPSFVAPPIIPETEEDVSELVEEIEEAYEPVEEIEEVYEPIEIYEPEVEETYTEAPVYTSGCLTRSGGVFWYGDQRETWYNLDMSGIVSSIQNRTWLWNDIADEYKQNVEGEYWIREDGCKMLGNYIMVAANLSVHPRGSLVETSLGTGVVVDTGGFAATWPLGIDIAVDWR